MPSIRQPLLDKDLPQVISQDPQISPEGLSGHYPQGQNRLTQFRVLPQVLRVVKKKARADPQAFWSVITMEKSSPDVY